MANWKPLSIDKLPLLIAGPILRRTTESSVSVWFVLKERRQVKLEVFSDDKSNHRILQGTHNGIKLSNNLFVYLITADKLSVPNSAEKSKLKYGTNYFYDIDFGNNERLSALISKKEIDITYEKNNLPSFSLPPNDISQVRIIHGSCRKPHGEGKDALAYLDKIISDSKLNALKRPHLLFLTGDQIYADDVADSLLYMIIESSKKLFDDWKETSFDKDFDTNSLKPGLRNGSNLFYDKSKSSPVEYKKFEKSEDSLLNKKIGLTGMFDKKPEYSKSHLLKFQEYFLMYIFCWSDVLWGSHIPEEEVFDSLISINDEQDKKVFFNFPLNHPLGLKGFFEEVRRLEVFKKTLPKIRRVLANVPTYMIFDDHDITDDWNLNLKWCDTVYGKSLGKLVVHNALCAYSICQAWGNKPFDINNLKLLNFLNDPEKKNKDSKYYKERLKLLNIDKPKKLSPNSKELTHKPNTIYWNYNLVFPNFDVWIMDSRTWRYYPIPENFGETNIQFCELISSIGFDEQLKTTNTLEKKINIIVCPAPVVPTPIVEFVKKQSIERTRKFEALKKSTFHNDTEEWSLNPISIERLYSRLCQKLILKNKNRNGKFIFLSGDIHYSYTVREQIWSEQLFEEKQRNRTKAIFAHLTASSLKNEVKSLTGSITYHLIGYYPAASLPKPIQRFGWNKDDVFKYESNQVDQDGKKITIVGRLDEPTITEDEYNEKKRAPYGGTTSSRLLEVPKPDWIKRIDFIGSKKLNFDPIVFNGLAQSIFKKELERLKRNDEVSFGQEIVGVNNIGEVNFNVIDKKIKEVVSIIWWIKKSKIGPHTIHKVSLDYDRYKEPKLL